MTHRTLEHYLYAVRADGLQTDKSVFIGVTPGKTPNLYVAGNLTVAGTISSGAESITSQLVTSNSANAFTVGANGLTAPVFNVDASASTVKTGLNLQGLAAGSGVNLSATSSGTNEGFNINAKGSGTLALQNTSTGSVYLGSNTAIHSGSANALAVGPNDVTNPAFNVDGSTASSATGLNIKSAAAGGGIALSALSSGTNEALTLDAKGSGTLGLNTSSTTAGAVTIGNATAKNGLNVNGATVITSNSGGALKVGPNGTTNPALQVNASTASAATGLQVFANTAGAGVALTAISSGTNENISLDSKGSGAILIGTNSGGGIQIGNTTTVVSNTATPAGGTSSAVLLFGTTSGFGIYFGSGAPTVSAAQGSLYLRSDGSSTSTRLYVNNSTGAGTSWTAVTTAA